MITILHFLYKITLSPILEFLFGKGCRFEPTCSNYAKESLKKYGIIKGGFLTVRRISHCHPFSKLGYYDPVA